MREYLWSSYCEYLWPPDQRPAWLRVERLFREMGIPQDSMAGCEQFDLRMEQRRGEALGSEWKAIRHGWCFGEEAFRRELPAQRSGQMGEHHYGTERGESAAEKAVRIVREELAKAGRAEEDLASRAKGDPVKVAVAARLRQETTVTLKWISQRLHMGAWTHLNKRLYEQRKAGACKN